MNKPFEINNAGCLVVESERIKECIEYIKNNEIKALSISTMEFRNKDIDFLKYCPNIEEIAIISPINNYDGLYELKRLKKLTIFDPVGNVDFGLINDLNYLHISLNKQIKNLNTQLNLETLIVRDYKPVRKNLEELPNSKNLLNLDLIQCNITSLDGCEKYKKLRNLGLYYLSKLEDVTQICSLSNGLKTLEIENCKKVQVNDFLSCLKEVEILHLINCGDIPSINFIKNMEKIKNFLFYGTNVLNGDVSPCFGLEYVSFTNKKHYNHKENEFNNELPD